MKKILTSIFLLVLPVLVHSQGEDSTKFERDEMIISEFYRVYIATTIRFILIIAVKCLMRKGMEEEKLRSKKLKPMSLVSLILLLMPIFLKKP